MIDEDDEAYPSDWDLRRRKRTAVDAGGEIPVAVDSIENDLVLR